MEYELKSGTTVVITDDRMEIIRTGAKSAVKSLMAGRTGGETIITASAITGAVYNNDYLMVFASGFPSPSDFKLTNIMDIKQFPNCIVGKNSELQEVYNGIIELIQKHSRV